MSGEDDEDVIVISLSIIVAVIVVIAVVFLARLLCMRSKKIEVRHGQATVGGKAINIKTMDSQPTMEKQFQADNLDMMELTKNQRRLESGSLRSKSGGSRQNSHRGVNDRATIDPSDTLQPAINSNRLSASARRDQF